MMQDILNTSRGDTPCLTRMTFTKLTIACLMFMSIQHVQNVQGSKGYKVYKGSNSKSSESQESACEDCEIRALTKDEVQQLDDAYNFTAGEFGPFVFGQIWQSEETFGCNEPQANAYLILLNDGICGRWSTWQEDRYYHWHEGQAVIDKISPDGELVSDCLGSTAQDATCRYVVKIPKFWKANIRTTEPLAVLTSVIMNGNNRGGKNFDYQFMLDTYGQKFPGVIEATEICYNQ